MMLKPRRARRQPRGKYVVLNTKPPVGLLLDSFKKNKDLLK